MKVYDLVHKLLQENKLYRNSDQALIWAVYQELNIVRDDFIYKNAFLYALPCESIPRTRRKVQELNKELRADAPVLLKRSEKEDTRGNFVFDEM